MSTMSTLLPKGEEPRRDLPPPEEGARGMLGNQGLGTEGSARACLSPRKPNGRGGCKVPAGLRAPSRP